eukprot:COSAG04_NODE_22742_length_350_cov_0.298805_1_plen_31_part_10
MVLRPARLEVGHYDSTTAGCGDGERPAAADP